MIANSLQKDDLFYKKQLNLDQSTYLNVALTKKLFSRPTDDELLYETKPDTTFTVYFKNEYYQKLKTEIQKAYDAGKFAKTSTASEWNNLKRAVDTAEKTNLENTIKLKPYLSDFIENTTPLTRTLVFKSNKLSINQGLLDFSPKKIDKKYSIEVRLSEVKTEIVFTDISTNTSALIGNLHNSSVGEGGMILNNEKYLITIDWDKAHPSNIHRVAVSLKEKESRMTYYNE